ncbi:MAG: hypothetical protein GX900_06015 [Clostridiaceae bacterium]|nr:hypothetical protein [Clostridiaceae bacterium]
MISCTEFIPSYSLLFSWLEEQDGYSAVTDYWAYIRDRPSALANYVEQYGLFGCFKYWTHTLNEEAADFVMDLYLNRDGTGEFTLNMRYCPSKGRLLEYDHFKPHHDYCAHCAALYPPRLAEFGIRADIDESRVDQAACRESYFMDTPPDPAVAAAGWAAAQEALAKLNAESAK